MGAVGHFSLYTFVYFHLKLPNFHVVRPGIGITVFCLAWVYMWGYNVLICPIFRSSLQDVHARRQKDSHGKDLLGFSNPFS